jgi:hypothetical protein
MNDSCSKDLTSDGALKGLASGLGLVERTTQATKPRRGVIWIGHSLERFEQFSQGVHAVNTAVEQLPNTMQISHFKLLRRVNG